MVKIRTGYWRAWLQLQSDRIERGRISPASLAQVYAFLGETEQAFKALGQAATITRSTSPR